MTASRGRPVRRMLVGIATGIMGGAALFGSGISWARHHPTSSSFTVTFLAHDPDPALVSIPDTDPTRQWQIDVTASQPPVTRTGL